MRNELVCIAVPPLVRRVSLVIVRVMMLRLSVVKVALTSPFGVLEIPLTVPVKRTGPGVLRLNKVRIGVSSLDCETP